MKDWTIEDLQKAVAEKNLKSWSFRSCSLCHAPLFYLFEFGQVGIDTNCDCVTYRTEPRLSSWENMASAINQPSPYWRMANELSFFGDTQFTLEEGLAHIEKQMNEYPHTEGVRGVREALLKAKIPTTNA